MKMKRMRRFSIIIALAICSLLGITVLAANTSNVTFGATLKDSTLCLTGEEQLVTLIVKGSTAFEMDSFTAQIKLPKGFELQEISHDKVFLSKENNYNVANGTVMWYNASGENVETDQLAEITISVPANSAVGEYPIDVYIIDISKNYAEDIWVKDIALSTTLVISNHADGDDVDHDCDNCGKKNVDEGHHGGANTCVAGAVCVECGVTYGSIDSNNHVNKTEHVQEDATCLEKGYAAGTYCEDCDKWISGHEEIPAIGHKNKVHHEKVDATCVTTGTIEYWSCPDCGKNFSNEACTTVVTELTIPIDPDNHDLVTTEAKAPTCTEIGWDEYVTCQREGCGHTTYVEKPATDHAWGVPDYTDNGDGTHTATYACGNNGEHIKSDDPAEHRYIDNKCVCGAEKPVQTGLRGDVNLDGEVTSADLTALARHLGLLEEITDFIALQNADTNNDGEISSADLTKLARYLGLLITDWDQE